MAKKTKTHPPSPPPRPRRRKEGRYSCAVALRVKCSSWESFHELFCGNIGKTGLFIPSSAEAKIGEMAQIELFTPDRRSIRFQAVVRHRVEADPRHPSGLGVELVSIHRGDQLTYERLVEHAAQQMMPEVSPAVEAAARAATVPAHPAVTVQNNPAIKPPSGRTPHRPPPQAVPKPTRPLVDESQTPRDSLDIPIFDEESRVAAQPSAPDARRSATAGSRRSVRNRVTAESAIFSDVTPVRSEVMQEQASSSGAMPIEQDEPTNVGAPLPGPALPPSPRRDGQGSPTIVALDFGTSRSSVSVVANNQVSVIRLPDGGWDIPSVVGFLESGEVVVGVKAQQMLARDPTTAVSSPKRLLGRSFDDREIQPYLASLAVGHSKGDYDDVLLHVRGRSYTIAQICAPIIFQLKAAAEAYLGQPITEAVFTTPVSFDRRRFAALSEAASLAGLRVSEFVDEPTAAALAHRFDHSFGGMIAVYDFGGGTFDFAVVDVRTADVQVVATGGDVWLGGDDFDEAIASAAANAFWRQSKIEIRHQVDQWQRILLASEQAKRALSSDDRARVEVPRVALRSSGPLDLLFDLTRPKFDELAQPVVQRSIDTCSQSLELSDLTPDHLQAVYLSGGTTYIPAVREAVAQYFGKAPRAAVPPERAVVIGAAVYASMLMGGSIR